MKLEYARLTKRNFGDDLNPWLWPKVLPGCFNPDDGVIFLGIGTILTQKRYEQVLRNARKIVVFSSGTWENDHPVLNDQQWKVYGVRGPLTARNLGLPLSYVCGDGAYLLRNFIDPQPASMRHGTAFIPHHRSEDIFDFHSICSALGMQFVTTRQPVESFLATINQHEYVIAEAMHGAIAADALRVPWRAVRFGPDFSLGKWNDWGQSMDISISPTTLPLVYSKRTPFFAALEKATKNKLIEIGAAPNRWKTSNYSFLKSSKPEQERLLQAIDSLKEERAFQLSSDERVEETIRKLNTISNSIANDTKKNSRTKLKSTSKLAEPQQKT